MRSERRWEAEDGKGVLSACQPRVNLFEGVSFQLPTRAMVLSAAHYFRLRLGTTAMSEKLVSHYKEPRVITDLSVGDKALSEP